MTLKPLPRSGFQGCMSAPAWNQGHPGRDQWMSGWKRWLVLAYVGLEGRWVGASTPPEVHSLSQHMLLLALARAVVDFLCSKSQAPQKAPRTSHGPFGVPRSAPFSRTLGTGRVMARPSGMVTPKSCPEAVSDGVAHRSADVGRSADVRVKVQRSCSALERSMGRGRHPMFLPSTRPQLHCPQTQRGEGHPANALRPVR